MKYNPADTSRNIVSTGLLALIMIASILAPASLHGESAAKTKAAPLEKAAAKAKTETAPQARVKDARPKPAAKRGDAAKTKVKGAKKKAGPSPHLAAYAAMPPAARIAIQTDLIWTGDYSGIASGDFGEASIAAVKAFQRRIGSTETGFLTAQERSLLTAAATARQEEVGWRLIDEAATGARVGVPLKLAPQITATATGTRWSSGRGEVQIETFRIREPGTTLAEVYERQKKEPATRRVEYEVMRGDSFVLSGLQGLKKFYVRAAGRQDDVRGVVILYDQAMDGVMAPLVVAMSNAYVPFPTTVAGPVPRRRVEYGTGVIVDTLGHVVTDADVAEACEVLRVSGLGNAELVARERSGALALLRVYGERNLKPVAAGETRADLGLMLVGIADPEEQGGGNSVTSLGVRLGEGEPRAIEPLPRAGFSGAPAFDREGRLAGIGIVRAPVGAGPAAPRAWLMPIETLEAFVRDHGITLARGSPGIEAAKAAVARIICVRKLDQPAGTAVPIGQLTPVPPRPQ
jgi:hypothetical protein